MISDSCEQNHTSLFWNLKRKNNIFSIQNFFENKCLKFYGGKFSFEECTDFFYYWDLEFLEDGKGDGFVIKNILLKYCLFFKENENGKLFLDIKDCMLLKGDQGIWSFN